MTRDGPWIFFQWFFRGRLSGLTPTLPITWPGTHAHAITPNGQFSVSNSPMLPVFGLWGKVEHPEETHAEYANSTQSAFWLSWDSNQGTVQLNEPLCHSIQVDISSHVNVRVMLDFILFSFMSLYYVSFQFSIVNLLVSFLGFWLITSVSYLFPLFASVYLYFPFCSVHRRLSSLLWVCLCWV